MNDNLRRKYARFRHSKMLKSIWENPDFSSTLHTCPHCKKLIQIEMVKGKGYKIFKGIPNFGFVDERKKQL